MLAEAFALLSPSLKTLLGDAGIQAPTPPQAEAIPLIARGENVLVIAPTGSGKTEAALLPLIDKMIQNKERQGISLVYITPLRALNRDLLKRLQSWSAKLGFTVEVRHGDTPQKDRRRMSSRPPDPLITTPETLQAVLPGQRLREHLRHVKAIVVDEIHELAGDRRGVQMTVGLERLREVTKVPFQRVGLSATVGNPEDIAKFGSNIEGGLPGSWRLVLYQEHEWVRIEGDKCRIGVTDYAQNSLHEIVYVELPKVGLTVSQMQSMGTVESVKAVADVYSPVSGEVLEVNSTLSDAPELVNKSPYGDGWITIIRPQDLKKDLSSLLKARAYRGFLKQITEKK